MKSFITSTAIVKIYLNSFIFLLLFDIIQIWNKRLFYYELLKTGNYQKEKRDTLFLCQAWLEDLSVSAHDTAHRIYHDRYYGCMRWRRSFKGDHRIFT